jgi:hypothetical protein
MGVELGGIGLGWGADETRKASRISAVGLICCRDRRERRGHVPLQQLLETKDPAT